MKGGVQCWTLPAGYLGSCFIGSLLVFAGFSTVASKVASILVGIIMLFTTWWARKSWFTLLNVLFAVAGESSTPGGVQHMLMRTLLHSIGRLLVH